MSEKVRAKKTRSVAKKKTSRSSKAKTAEEVVKQVATKSRPAVKAKKKAAKRSRVTSSKKVIGKKSDESIDEMPLGSESEGSPPLEEMFAKASAQVDTGDAMDLEKTALNGARSMVSSGEAQVLEHVPASDEQCLKVRLSQALMRKLNQQAEDEGLSIDDFVTELLAESVVLRAWEIVERKNQMRNPAQGAQASGRMGHNSNNSNNNNNNNRGHRHNKNRGMNPGRYQSIMDDKATFLEYVRNQERSRR